MITTLSCVILKFSSLSACWMRELWRSAGIILSRTPAFILSKSFPLKPRSRASIFVSSVDHFENRVALRDLLWAHHGHHKLQSAYWSRGRAALREAEPCFSSRKVGVVHALHAFSLHEHRDLRSLASLMLFAACASTSTFSVSSSSAQFNTSNASWLEERAADLNVETPVFPFSVKLVHLRENLGVQLLPVVVHLKPLLCAAGFLNLTQHLLNLLGMGFIRGLHVRFDCAVTATELLHHFTWNRHGVSD